MDKPKPEKKIIGRSDIVDLPDLGVKNIHAKIDTGAYRSSIHCKKVRLEGESLKFTLPTESNAKEYQTHDWERKMIKSSNGESQERFVIRTKIRLFGKDYKASISLTDRSEMKNPLLIGRRMLKDRFIVDVSKKNLSYQEHSKTLK
ncbi:MAG: RimK/LysX family protein [Bacteroidota bacterium]